MPPAHLNKQKCLRVCYCLAAALAVAGSQTFILDFLHLLPYCSLRAIDDLIPLVSQPSASSSSSGVLGSGGKGAGASSGSLLGRALGLMRQLPDIDRLLKR